MPNATARVPAAMAHLGRLDNLFAIVKLRADRMFADLSLRLRHQDDF
jgi:2-oxoglutarate dehydrogenase complex dehydrogenase (E1) component-like enzyme